MARLCSIATGNNTSASTWAVIDSTSFNEFESNTITVPTTYSTTYTTFTPGAITVDAIGFRLGSRLGTTGTFSIELYNVTAGASVAGTEVTIDCADFTDSTATLLEGGWYVFKFSSAVTLLAANAYRVRFKTSSGTQISTHGSSSSNPSRFLRTTTTAAPAAGDDRFVCGEWTGAGSLTSYTVTLDDTSNTDYGSTATSLVNPALSINRGGEVVSGSSASTAYIQKMSGNMVVYNGGILRIGTSGSRIPSTSSVTWTFDCVTNVDFGIDVRRKGEFTCYGEVKQRWTLLTSDEASSSTSIQVVSTSGWKAGDTLCFAPTGTTTSQYETKVISTVDSSTQVTLSAGLTNAHTGTDNVVGEVGNLTSNVQIYGVSSTVGTYVNLRDGALFVADNVEFQFLGSSSTNKRGIEFASTISSTNSITIESCAIRTFSNSNGFLGTIAGSSSSFYYINNNVLYNSTSSLGFTFNGGHSASSSFSVDDNLLVGSGNSTGFTINNNTSFGGTIQGNRVAGFSVGVSISSPATAAANLMLTIDRLHVHSCTNGFTATGSPIPKIITNSSFNRNTTSGATHGYGETLYDDCNFIGNGSQGMSYGLSGTSHVSRTIVNNSTFRGDSGFNQAVGLNTPSQYSGPSYSEFNNCSFGSTTAHTTSDIGIGSYQNFKILFNNCTFASTTEISSLTTSYLEQGAYIGMQRIDGTAGLHRAYIKQAIIDLDAGTFRTAAPSIKITPKHANSEIVTTKLRPFFVPVLSGQTCTPTVYVYEDASYNGGRAKLYVKANLALGITSDTLLDTATAASDLAWEGLTGTTAAVTDDGILEFYVTCNGTAGALYIDDFSATVA